MGYPKRHSRMATASCLETQHQQCSYEERVTNKKNDDEKQTMTNQSQNRPGDIRGMDTHPVVWRRVTAASYRRRELAARGAGDASRRHERPG